MKTPEGDAIRQILKTHRGRDQAIHARDIATELGWTEGRERLVRRIIADESMLWVNGPAPILTCSAAGPDGGYFAAGDVEEAYAYESWLTELRNEAQARLDGFVKICGAMGIRFIKEAA